MKKATKKSKVINKLFQISLVLGSSLLSVSAISAQTDLYLKGDGVPVASLSENAPASVILPNYDPGRNAFPGLLIEKGGNGMFETDPVKYQQWVSPSNGITIDGPTSLIFWSGMKDFGTDKRGIVEAYLLDCDNGGFDCSLIAQSQKDIFNWSGGWGSFNKNSIEFGDLTYTVADGRSLSVKILVGADSDDDMWFAYDTTSFPTKITDSSSSDIVIDCDFSDWCNGEGTEFCIDDQGGWNDWRSPAKLDITSFAISSNLIDAFHLLIGIDDVPPQDTTAATLLDTDLDSNINFALVTNFSGIYSSLELYSCDDTIRDGCSGASLERIYPQSYYCTASSQGPWDTDIFMEAVLPIYDLDLNTPDPIYISTLISYAAAALLTSPKDSVLGETEQNYSGGIYFDTDTGRGKLVGPLGQNYLIRRHTDPALVRTSDPHTTVSQAPFDDLSGSLTDGLSYYYVIDKEGGLPAKISVQPNASDNAVRLGFDDHDSQSAPVDSTLSSVSIDRSTVIADGTSSIAVKVVPRDSMGVTIGGGCELSVDEIQLSPGSLAGPIRDHQDGSYSFEVVSLISDVADVVVFVEGIELDSQYTIIFTDSSPDMLPVDADQDLMNSSNEMSNSIKGDSTSSNGGRNVHRDHSKNRQARFPR